MVVISFISLGNETSEIPQDGMSLVNGQVYFMRQFSSGNQLSVVNNHWVLDTDYWFVVSGHLAKKAFVKGH